MRRNYYIYILTNWKRTTLYIGVTSNLKRRIHEHKSEIVDGFTKKYKLKYLVYYEEFTEAYRAIEREKQLKRWSRNKKYRLIATINPNLRGIQL